jgi:hypothetical protein
LCIFVFCSILFYSFNSTLTLALPSDFNVPIHVRGLFKLARRNSGWTKSKGSTSAARQAAEKKVTIELNSKFIFGDSKAPLVHAFITHLLKAATDEGWSCESDICPLVKAIINEAIQYFPFKEMKLSVCTELRYGGNSGRSDICIVLSNGSPILVIEVKKPGANLTDKAMCMQLLDYMASVRLDSGMPCFGILTNYEEWYVCWEEGLNKIAAEAPPEDDVLTAMRKVRLASESTVISQEPEAEGDKNQEITAYLNEQKLETLAFLLSCHENVKMYVSPQILWSDKDNGISRVFAVLRAALKKACVVGKHAPLLRRLWAPGVVKKCLMLGCSMANTQKAGFAFRAIPNDGTAFCPNEYASKDTTNFLLLRTLGVGIHGHASLAANFNGKVAVLKRQSPDAPPGETLATEHNVWKAVFPKGVRLEEVWLHGTAEKVLVMPYFKPATECRDLVTVAQVKSAAKSAIERLAKAGYQHDDLEGKWCHVGLFINISTGKLDAVLIDLARVLEVKASEPEAVQAAVDAMSLALGVDALQTKSLGPNPYAELPIPNHNPAGWK